MGVEPTSYAWEAYALPLCYTRKNTITHHRHLLHQAIRERNNGYKNKLTNGSLSGIPQK